MVDAWALLRDLTAPPIAIIRLQKLYQLWKAMRSRALAPDRLLRGSFFRSEAPARPRHVLLKAT